MDHKSAVAEIVQKFTQLQNSSQAYDPFAIAKWIVKTDSLLTTDSTKELDEDTATAIKSKLSYFSSQLPVIEKEQARSSWYRFRTTHSLHDMYIGTLSLIAAAAWWCGTRMNRLPKLNKHWVIPTLYACMSLYFFNRGYQDKDRLLRQAAASALRINPLLTLGVDDESPEPIIFFPEAYSSSDGSGEEDGDGYTWCKESDEEDHGTTISEESDEKPDAITTGNVWPDVPAS